MKRILLALFFSVSALHASPLILVDASNSDSIVVDGSGAVVEWRDLSGYSNSALPSLGLVYPELSAFSPSGLLGIDFRSSNNSLQLLDSTASDELFDFSQSNSGKTGFAVLVVARAAGVNGSWNDVIGNNTSESSGFGMRFSNQGRIAAYLKGGLIQKPVDQPITAGTSFVMAANYNAATGLFQFYDSVTNSVASTTVAAADFGQGHAFTVGSTTNSGRYLNGSIYEVIVYDRPLSASQFAAECDLLELKWLSSAPAYVSPYVHLDALDSSISYGNGGFVASWSDLSGNGFHATDAGDAVTHSAGANLSGSGIGGVSFNDTSKRLEVMSITEQDAVLDFTGAAAGKSGFAVLVAFKVDSFSSDWNDILGSDSSFSDGFTLRMGSDGRPVATVEGADARSSGRVVPGETVVYALNYDALAGAYGFWDSVSNRTLVENVAAGDFSEQKPFTIGRSDNPGRYFNGSIYELKVFDTKLSSEQLEIEKTAMQERWFGLELPVEVLGEEGTVTERQLYLTAEDLLFADRLWLQVNNLSYENKGSISLNGKPWRILNHDSVEMQYQEARRGGMAHGGFNTIRFSVPLAADELKVGWNKIRFRFNESDAISIGYRVVGLNLLDASGSHILAESRFYEQNPAIWEGPYTDSASVAAGEALWRTANLWSHNKAAGQSGWWYDHIIPAAAPIKAKCMDCHTQDGRDLEMFSYSNASIIKRAEFHQLTEEQGKLIASYIRSLTKAEAEVGRYGRPWNPPYQPGPSVADLPVEQWAAGAGLDAVLDQDADLRDYLFPNGEITEDTVNDFFDATKMLDHTLIPLSIQFPDWKHWLPMIHPKDAWDRNGYYDNPTRFSSGISANVKASLIEFRGHINSMLSNGVNFSKLESEYKEFRNDFRFFVASGDLIDNDGNSSGGSNHWRTLWGDANKNGLDLGSNVIYDAEDHSAIRQFATTSLARLLAVKNFEFHNELRIQGRARDYIAAVDQPNDRQWISDDYNVFEVPPHFNTPLNGGRHFDGQLQSTGEFESTSWYHLQMVLNSGNGQMSHNSPVDYNYTPPFVLDGSDSSGLFEPLRYFTVLNTAYQTKTWSGGMSPNTGKGFRIRVMGPWYIANISDNTDLNGFPPGYILSLLDDIEPGMSHWVMNAMLELFLTEVEKPHNALSGWTRYTNGADWSNTLDPISTSVYQDPLDPDSDLESIGDWAHRIFYMVRFLSERGADPSKIDRLINWGKAAWPNLKDGSTRWDNLRGQSKTTIVLDPNQTGLAPFDSISVKVHNGGSNPNIKWYVNDVLLAVPTSTKELSYSWFQPGDTIRVLVTGNPSGISSNNKVAEAIYVVPEVGFQVTSSSAQVPTSGRYLANQGETLGLQIAPIANPTIWLDAFNVSAGTEPNDGNSVTTWQDLSGNGYDAVAPSSSFRPKYRADAIRGRPGIEFGRTGLDGLELLDASEDDILDDDFTLFILGSADVASGAAEMDLIGNDTSTTNDGEGWRLRLRDDEQIQVSAGGASDTMDDYDHRQFILRVVKSGTSLSIYYNGRPLANWNLAASATLTRDNDRSTYIGVTQYTSSTATNYFRGYVGEFLFYDRPLSKGELDVVESYLSHKWFDGTTLSTSNKYFTYSPVSVTVVGPQGGTSILAGADLSRFEFSLDDDQSLGNYRIGLEGITPAYDLQLLRRQSYETWTTNNTPGVGNRSGDFDFDGVTNYLEYVMGSDPADSSDRPESYVLLSSTLVEFEVPMRVDDDTISYQIQVSSNLSAPSGGWQTVDLPYTTDYSGGSVERLTFEYPSGGDQLFFRLLVVE